MIRGYLANAEKVRVRGAEFDGSARIGATCLALRRVAYTDGTYVSFPDAPPPLEDTGGPQVKDISGSDLPGISKWALSLGGEYGRPRHDLRPAGQLFGALDASYRSSFSSSATASGTWSSMATACERPGRVPGGRGWTVTLWSRNLLNEDYFELLTAAPGNTGLFVGQPGDPRTVGVSLRVALGRKKPEGSLGS